MSTGRGYSCTRCHRSFSEFRLLCPGCGAWKSIRQADHTARRAEDRPIPLPQVSADLPPRITIGIESFDALLGGGFVPGSSILLIGPPGAGKSTLVMQILHRIAGSSLYVTGEESLQQLKLRADRLGINSEGISLLFETNVSTIKSSILKSPVLVLVIDSIQTVYSDLSDTLPGSITQIRKCAYLLRRAAQEASTVLILVGQVTKDRGAAGPKLLEHAVDVVLYLDIIPESPNGRVLLASKNRFGSTAKKLALHMMETGFVF